ncbi:IS1096 element passenger TnpR family protein [Cupriavidus lacunae]|uniref:Plasmid pRiA4b ORF-3 family protein n=1 Tax=Cupriavidus lacunae TaxID=2666307 RepID=A0A370NNS4_9BURK|nr:plasmid pRiA4b ORF-3 family protein [Cupriavidus lacunae]
MASDPGPATPVLQLRIALRGLSPPVWRRVLVPEHLTLGQLHHVIQVVMGWDDEHLLAFSIRGRRYGEGHGGGGGQSRQLVLRVTRRPLQLRRGGADTR